MAATSVPGATSTALTLTDLDGSTQVNAPFQLDPAVAALPPIQLGQAATLSSVSLPTAQVLFYATPSQSGTCSTVSVLNVIHVPQIKPIILPWSNPSVKVGSIEKGTDGAYGTSVPCLPGTTTLIGDLFVGLLIKYPSAKDVIEIQVPFAFTCPITLGSICKSDLAVCYLSMKWFGTDFRQCITRFAYLKYKMPVHSDTHLASGQIPICLVTPGSPPITRPGFLASGPALREESLNYGTYYQVTASTGAAVTNMYPPPTYLGTTSGPLSVLGEYYMLQAVSWQPNIYYVAQDAANVLHCGKYMQGIYDGRYIYGSAYVFVFANPSIFATYYGILPLQISFGVGFPF